MVHTIRPVDIWQPQPKQTALLQLVGLDKALYGGLVRPAVCECIGYGGAAFGGKTEGLLGVGLIACMMIPGVKVGFFRRKFTELEGSDGAIERSHALFGQAGAHYNDQKHTWYFGQDEEKGTSAALRFCHCQYELDVQDYLSAAFDILLIDEATQFSWYIIDHLIARNRPSKASKIPKIFRVLSANPGGIGHSWFMQIFGINNVLSPISPKS